MQVDIKEAVNSLEIKTNDYSKQGILAAIQGAIAMGGFSAFKIAVIVANAVAKQIIGRGLTFAANASLSKAIGIFSGPIGWAITALWTVIDIAGPAYRVTIPCIIQVAYMKKKTK